MAAYLVYQGEVLDPERYEVYKTKAFDSITRAGGRYIVRGGELEILEGEPPMGRIVVLEFPSLEVAHNWYHGAEYTEIKKLREGVARARIFLVDGVH